MVRAWVRVRVRVRVRVGVGVRVRVKVRVRVSTSAPSIESGPRMSSPGPAAPLGCVGAAGPALAI